MPKEMYRKAGESMKPKGMFGRPAESMKPDEKILDDFMDSPEKID